MSLMLRDSTPQSTASTPQSTASSELSSVHSTPSVESNKRARIEFEQRSHDLKHSGSGNASAMMLLGRAAAAELSLEYEELVKQTGEETLEFLYSRFGPNFGEKVIQDVFNRVRALHTEVFNNADSGPVTARHDAGPVLSEESSQTAPTKYAHNSVEEKEHTGVQAEVTPVCAASSKASEKKHTQPMATEAHQPLSQAPASFHGLESSTPASRTSHSTSPAPMDSIASSSVSMSPPPTNAPIYYIHNPKARSERLELELAALRMAITRKGKATVKPLTYDQVAAIQKWFFQEVMTKRNHEAGLRLIKVLTQPEVVGGKNDITELGVNSLGGNNPLLFRVCIAFQEVLTSERPVTTEIQEYRKQQALRRLQRCWKQITAAVKRNDQKLIQALHTMDITTSRGRDWKSVAKDYLIRDLTVTRQKLAMMIEEGRTLNALVEVFGEEVAYITPRTYARFIKYIIKGGLHKILKNVACQILELKRWSAEMETTCRAALKEPSLVNVARDGVRKLMLESSDDAMSVDAMDPE